MPACCPCWGHQGHTQKQAGGREAPRGVRCLDSPALSLAGMVGQGHGPWAVLLCWGLVQLQTPVKTHPPAGVSRRHTCGTDTITITRSTVY